MRTPPTRPGRSQAPHAAAAFARRFAAVTPGWRILFGSEASWDELLLRVQRYPIPQILALVSRLNGVLGRLQGVEGQVTVARELLGDAAPNALRRLDRYARSREMAGSERPPILFHEAQALTLLRVALLNRAPAEGPPCESLRPFGEALLMLTDLADDADTGDLRSIAAGLTASSLFNQAPVPVHGLARGVELYLTDRPELRGDSAYVDVPAELRRITGVEPVLAWLLFIALYGFVDNLPLETAGQPMDLMAFLNFRGDEGQREAPSPPVLPREEVERLVALVRTPLEELAQRVQERAPEPGRVRLYDVLQFAEFPFVHHAGRDYCLSVDLLLRKLTHGLHYLLLHPERTTTDERRRYLTFRGAIFERYVDDTLRRCLPAGEGHYTGLITPPTVAGQRLRCCDAAWASGDALVLFEIKGKQLDAESRAGEREALEAKFEDIIFHAARQLDSSVQAFRDGRLRIDGIDPTRIKRFFPLVVTLEDLVMEPLTHGSITAEVARRGLLQVDGTRPLQLLNVSELELLEVGLRGGLKLLHILAMKQALPEWRGVCFHNFLRHQYPQQFQGAKNPHLVEVFYRTKERGEALLREREAVARSHDDRNQS